jgi:cytochrome c oxidase cbb3-type subunit 3
MCKNKLDSGLIVILLQFNFALIASVSAEGSRPDDLSVGGEIYNYYCYQCHGYSGDAKTLASSYLDPKPRDFTATRPESLTRESMLKTLREGRPGTAMVSFSSVLDEVEIEAVVDYVRDNLMLNNPLIRRYHTNENGWPEHERFSVAFPFITGEILLETPWEKLNEAQRAGKRLYIKTCITCHDHGQANSSRPIWEIQAVSYPRKHYSHRMEDVDALSGASVHQLHEIPISETGLNPQEKQGRRLYLDNCAFCHAPDGSARNWIGSFLSARPRDFTADNFIDQSDDDYLRQVILEGLSGTSMPAWGQVLTMDQVNAIIAFLKRSFGKDQPSVE